MQTLSACICKDDCDLLKQFVSRVVIAFVVVPSHCCLHSMCFWDRLHPRMMLKLSRRIDKINGIEKFKLLKYIRINVCSIGTKIKYQKS